LASPRTIARLEARIHERAAYCLQFELRDPRATFVTVTRAELSPDLQHVKVHWSVLGSEGERNKAAAMLERAAGFVQRQVARVLDTRTVPHLRFVHDDSLERAADLDRLISAARERDAQIRGTEEDDADAEEPGPQPSAG